MRVNKGILRRNVNNNHYLIKHRAYAFDVAIMKTITATWSILQIITPTGRTYQITKKDFYEKAKINNEFGKEQYLIEVKDLSIMHRVGSKSIVISQETHAKIKAEAKSRGVTISQELQDKYC